MCMKRILLRITTVFVFFIGAVNAEAQSIGLGVHGGGLGITGEANGGIAYGAHIIAHPFSLAGFKVDATFAGLDGGTFFSTSPAFILFPLDYLELKMGLLGGATLMKAGTGADMKFGLNFGALGELGITETFAVGMEGRYHSMFESEDFWTVLLTTTFHFELGGW